MSFPGDPGWDYEKQVPVDHPIEDFCKKWHIDSQPMKDDLVKIVTDLVASATAALLEDDDL